MYNIKDLHPFSQLDCVMLINHLTPSLLQQSTKQERQGLNRHHLNLELQTNLFTLSCLWTLRFLYKPQQEQSRLTNIDLLYGSLCGWTGVVFLTLSAKWNSVEWAQNKGQLRCVEEIQSDSQLLIISTWLACGQAIIPRPKGYRRKTSTWNTSHKLLSSWWFWCLFVSWRDRFVCWGLCVDLMEHRNIASTITVGEKKSKI